jgi:hypothetical protein
LSFNNDTTRYCDGTDNATLNLGAFDNNGGANVVVPDLDVGRGRVRVACTNPSTPYFNITSADLSVTGVGAATSDCREIDEVASYGRYVEVSFMLSCHAAGAVPA